MRNIESFMLEESKFVLPDINMPETDVGVFWNHPDYKNRIRSRTSEMMNMGLITEMNAISNPSKTVLQAIGMNLSNDLEENINLKTNRLAKKNLTWFKQEDRIKIVDTDDKNIIREEMEKIIDG